MCKGRNWQSKTEAVVRSGLVGWGGVESGLGVGEGGGGGGGRRKANVLGVGNGMKEYARVWRGQKCLGLWVGTGMQREKSL